MAIIAERRVVTTPATQRIQPRFQAMQRAISQRMITASLSVPPKVAIGTERPIQMTFPTGVFIATSRLAVMLDVAEIMISRPDLGLVIMA
jgi:hypothetical protein